MAIRKTPHSSSLAQKRLSRPLDIMTFNPVLFISASFLVLTLPQ